ncbi:MAG: hypothetical protein H6550_03955 [Chitinophagales bacterium]|nr:hypothetical protein [Chitinophagales bacterium]
MNNRIYIYGILFIAVMLGGCNNSSNPTGQAPPIKMGDPATIVTETDSQYLVDVVNDLNIVTSRPVTIASTEKDTSPQAPADSSQPTANTDVPAAPVTGAGLEVPFPQVTFFIPGIGTKTYKEPNLETDYGASYELTEGSLVGNKITIQGAEINDVYMRYQTIIVARNNLGTLPLESLRKLTEWKKVKGSNGVYQIEGLEDNKLQGLVVSNRAIRNAISRDARARNWSRNGIQQWLNSVRRTKNTKQKPMHSELRSVMWKVNGKDANGRPFTRQLRIDVPIAP